MRVIYIVKRLQDLVSIAECSQDEALMALGSANYLLNFLLIAAERNNLNGISQVAHKINEYRTGLEYLAGLSQETDAVALPAHHARAAIGCLTSLSMFGQKPELLQRNLAPDGKILSE